MRNATPETVLGFSRAWYRPENMAVTIVGDIDPAAVQKQLQPSSSPRVPHRGRRFPPTRRFPKPKAGTPRRSRTKRWRTRNRVDHHWSVSRDSYEAYRHFQLLDGLMSRFLNTRMSELARSAQPPFQGRRSLRRIAFGSSWERPSRSNPTMEKATRRSKPSPPSWSASGPTGSTRPTSGWPFPSSVRKLNRLRSADRNHRRRPIVGLGRAFSAAPSLGRRRGGPLGRPEGAGVGEPRGTQSVRPSRFGLSELPHGHPDARKTWLDPVVPQEILDVIARVQAAPVAAIQERTVVPLLDTVPRRAKFWVKRRCPIWA